MTTEAETISVSVNERDNVTALLYIASKKARLDVTLILGHGAGSNQSSPFMQLFAKGLAARGVDVLTFNFVYMEEGRRVPDQRARLESCYRAVIGAAGKHKKLKDNRLVIGGKSMGGRIASQVAAAMEDPALPERPAPAEVFDRQAGEWGSATISGLVFLGYPLHPPGNPEKLRDAHLAQIKPPMIFVQGSRDAFGTAEEIGSVIKRLKLPATLQAIEGGDHSLKVSKSSGVSQERVYESSLDEIADWLSLKLR